MFKLVHKVLTLFTSMSSEGSGKSMHMCRLARAFTDHIHMLDVDEYSNLDLLLRLISQHGHL